MNDAVTASVYLVGAGPGNPGLLTVRAAELLSKADLIIYDQLVPKRLLDGANPLAECICVRDLPGKHPEKYPQIFELMIERAKAGQTVVRLKGGDPLVFGRGGEEAEALSQAGVSFEIVPGVTAALSAAAYLDIPLTHRKHASAVALITGHELPDKTGNILDWKALAAFPGTLAIYMGVARLPILTAELLKYGKHPDTPSCLVERAGTGEMRSVSATLATLDEARRNAGLEAPGLILIGEVVALRREPSWFESQPLFGNRVMVTRPRHQSSDMIRKLELLGAVPILLPIMDISEPENVPAADELMKQFIGGHFQWIVFSSANGVHYFLNRLFAAGCDVRAFANVKIATVGAKTAKVIRDYHLHPDLVPDESFSAKATAQLLEPIVRGQKVLLPKANVGKDILHAALSKIADVHDIVVYDQVNVLDPSHEAFGSLRRGEIHFVTLASANTAKLILQKFDDIIRGRVLRGEIQIVVMSDDVAKAVEAAGLPVASVADQASEDGLIDAVMKCVA